MHIFKILSIIPGTRLFPFTVREHILARAAVKLSNLWSSHKSVRNRNKEGCDLTPTGTALIVNIHANNKHNKQNWINSFICIFSLKIIKQEMTCLKLFSFMRRFYKVLFVIINI